MFGQFYTGDYVFRNILNTPPQIGPNLGGIWENAAAQWQAAITDPHGLAQIHAEGQAVVEHANQLIHEYEGIYNSTAAKIASIQKINVKVANFLMEQLNAEQARHEPIVRGLTSELSGIADVPTLQNLTSQLESALASLHAAHDRAAKIAAMPPDKIEAMTPDTLTKLGNVLKYLVYGVIALAAVKYGPGIVKSFRKK